MNAVTVDVRMLRKGSRWCATARVCAPCLRAPVDLYASMDVRDAVALMQSLEASQMGGNVMAVASANARKAARRQVLGYTYNLFNELGPELRPYGSYIKSSLEACDKACDLVTRARGGDRTARTAIEGIFLRAKGGDADAERSARLILESADLVDEGRASFKVKVEMPAKASTKKQPLSLPLPKPVTGAESDLRAALYYPGSTIPNVPGKRASNEFVEESWEYLPYPSDTSSDMQLLQNFQPAVAAY